MARPTEFFQPKIVGRGPCAPPHLTGNPLPTSVGGDTYIAPPFDQNIPSNRVGGAAFPTPCDRRNSSYILECERQRRRKQVDTKLRPRPIDNPFADRKGSQETIRFPALLWVPSVRTESTPPETWTSLFHHQSPKNRQICRISRSTSASACGVSTSASSRASTSSSISSSSC